MDSSTAAARERDDRELSFIALSVALAVGMFWVVPYEWPTGNHAQEVLPILATLDRTLFPRDFAIQSFLGSTPRSAYQWIIAGTASAGVGVPGAYLLLQSMTFAAASVAVVRIGRWISNGVTHAGVVTVCLTLAFWIVTANHRGWNASLFDTGNAVPSTFAMGFVFWSWWNALRRRWLAAYSLLACAALLQVVVGTLAGLLLLPVAMVDVVRSRRHWRGIAAGAAAWLAGIIAVAGSTYAADPGRGSLSAAELVRIFGRVRIPHHWLPSVGGSMHWMNASLAAAAGLALATMVSRRGRSGRLAAIAVSTVVGTVILLLANYTFVERWPVAWIAKMQLQRTMPFALLGILGVLAWHLRESIAGGRHVLALALVLAPVAALHGVALSVCVVAIGFSRRLEGRTRLAVECAAVAGVLAFGSFGYVFDIVGATRRAALMVVLTLALLVIPHLGTRIIRRALVLGAIAIVSATIVAMTVPSHRVASPLGRRLLQSAPSVGRRTPYAPDLVELARVVRQCVPSEGILLAPPLPALEALPLLSQRGLVLSWKNVPYTDEGIQEWGRRLDDLMGARQERTPTEGEVAQAWRRRSIGQLAALGGTYGAAFVVTRADWHPEVPRRPGGGPRDWILWSGQRTSAPGCG